MEKISIKYGVAENANSDSGGFVPHVTNNGRLIGSTWRVGGMGKEDALKEAEVIAEEEAARYSGDWLVEVSLDVRGNPYVSSEELSRCRQQRPGEGVLPPLRRVNPQSDRGPFRIDRDGNHWMVSEEQRGAWVRIAGHFDRISDAQSMVSSTFSGQSAKLSKQAELESSMVVGIARAIWVWAWSQWQLDRGGDTPSDGNWEAFAPQTPPEVMPHAWNHARALERLNGKTMFSMVAIAAGNDEMDLAAVNSEYSKEFGFYLTLEVLDPYASEGKYEDSLGIKVPAIDAEYNGKSLKVKA